LFLDLSLTVDDWQLPTAISAAVFCAGITKIADCRRDPASTWRVNVEAVVTLIKQLARAGTYTVYLSTNQVFDGTVAQHPPDAPLSPQTEYGKQKAQVEQEIMSLADGAAAIVRLAKVFGPHTPVLHDWVSSLQRGEVIRPFHDMVTSPVTLCFVVSVLERLCETRQPGVFQVSSDLEVTYADIAYYLAEKIGVNRDLVQPIESIEAGIQRQAAPPHTSLHTARLSEQLGLEPPDVWRTIEYAAGLTANGID
jgi:dTDP-4-dehydrorhamnose reductase